MIKIKVDWSNGTVQFPAVEKAFNLSFEEFKAFLKAVMTKITDAEFKNFLQQYPDRITYNDDGIIYIYWKRFKEHTEQYGYNSLGKLIDGICPLCGYSPLRSEGDYIKCDGCKANILIDDEFRRLNKDE